MASSSVIGSRIAADKQTHIHWQHREAANPEFNPHIFTNAWLEEKGYIVNSPSAGRGASLFLNVNDINLVLRHYRRGGMVRSVSEQRYLWCGLKRTRAWREFAVLCELEEKGLPAPIPYACQVERLGMSYQASLITYYLSGSTLAEHVCTATLKAEYWQSVGRCIRAFHDHGVYHADLNAHNILLHEGKVSLIDFDRAVISRTHRESRYKSNLQRLKRSLGKIVSSGPAFYNEDCWVALTHGYMQP